MSEKKGLLSVPSKLRRLAEKRLRSENDASAHSLSNEEAQRLLHELQVHQIELEMQNEELRHARDERQNMEAKLGKYSDLYDFAPVGYFNLSQSGIVRAVNLSGAGLLGVERSLLIRRHLDLFISDETRPVFHDFLDKVFASETKKTCELVFQKKSHLPLYVQVEAVVSESREECRAVVIDITERRELERKLLHARKLESLGVLAGGIAHDFNNILAGVMGNLSILRMLLPEEKKALERIARCEKALSQATGLTSQLLTFSRGGEPVRKLADMRRIIADAVSFALPGSNVAASLSFADDLWAVKADEGQVGQVINNLLINAAQAMPDGGIVQVEAANCLLEREQVSSLVAGCYLRIRVTDQGTGIPAGDLERIFDPYFTTKKTGTGLGLTSVYSIVRKHGGDILVSSTVGGGTTFEVYLPASPELSTHGDIPAVPAISPGNGTVLVMDDEESIRDMTLEMLALLGYQAEGCSCGEELVDSYRSRWEQDCAPDAVIVDLTVPGKMGGLDAAMRILALDPAARLIVASGYSTDPVVANYRKYGFVAALAKPYRVEELSSELATVLAEMKTVPVTLPVVD